jgi:hypothetical protein
MINFIKNLKFIFKPMYWLMNNPYSEGWDDLLNHLMIQYKDDYVLGHVNDGKIYTIKFGDFVVWVQNYPYAFGTLYEAPKVYTEKVPGYRGVRPSRLTILKLHKMINDSMEKNIKANSVDVGFKSIISELLNK